MKTTVFSDCCPDSALKPITRVRHISPSIVISRPNVFLERLPSSDGRTNAIAYKCSMQRTGGKRDYEFKVGLTGSSSRLLQGIQAVGTSVTPGNISNLRNPVRSSIYSALTPGGGNLPGGAGFGALKPERGYRCPEGYQYGGRFTDSRFSTCGKQLFDIPGAIGRAIGQALRAGSGRGIAQTTSGRRVGALAVSGDIIQSRAPQIPKVSAANRGRKTSAVNELISQIGGAVDPYTRMVRRDGFVLEPVVSAAVLRTVPDNRDMEGATYILSALTPETIGNDEMGLLSNTGVDSIVYALNGGSSISLSKARPLTVGERRKLGKTISAAEKMSKTDDPTARLQFISGEMGDALAYNEKFIGISNPNEIISAIIPGGERKQNIRRWMLESFYKKRKKPKKGQEVVDVISEDERIKDLASAVRHLNNGGSIENVSATIRSEAVKRSTLYKSGKIKNGVILHERADGQTVFEIESTKDFEQLGAAFASEVQRSMGLIAPKVRIAGSGRRRPYMIGETQDVEADSVQKRGASAAELPAEDILAIAIADFLTDTTGRNPSNISPVSVAGQMRGVSSVNPGAGLPGMSAAEIRGRRQISLNEFFNRKQRAAYEQYFAKLQSAQRKKALVLYQQLLDRAQDFDLARFKQRLSNDGMLNDAERIHLDIMGKIFQQRLNTLKSSSGSLKKILGLSK